jgi:sulfur carrier protein
VVAALHRRARGGRRPDDTLKAVCCHHPAVHVTAEVVGEGTHDLALADDATYADLCRAVGYNPHEVAVLVEDTPVPEDRPVDASEVRLLRLLHGG